jgi:hypothetical protein
MFEKPEEINLQENESIDIEEYEIKTPKNIKLFKC